MENSPPKSPTMAANNIICWHNSQPPQPPPGLGLNHPSWANDFIEFSASKRRAHRRSISDVSAALAEEPRPVLAGLHGPTETNAAPRDGTINMRLDDEARFILSMLNDLKDAVDGTANSSSDPASTSSAPQKRCRREENPEKVNNHEEAESLKCDNKDHQLPCKLHQTRDWTELPPPSPADGANEAVNDPKRVKRILANRQSAQRSRVRKLQYISELERSMTRLQTEVSMLSPRVAYIDHQRMMLNVDNTALKSKIAALSHDKLFKDAHQEALKREIERLKNVYHQQSNVDDTTTNP
ncbi:hypothetical protein V2J09_006438 [Rumex salicifolius]